MRRRVVGWSQTEGIILILIKPLFTLPSHFYFSNELLSGNILLHIIEKFGHTTRIVVVVPPKAEFETGFRQWVIRIGNLATQVGCKAIFIAYKETIPYIQGVLQAEKYNISHEYREMESWDDFIMLSNRIHDDDLLVVIGARRTSISFSSDMEVMPTFLGRYFANHNIMIIYPEQFGAEAEMPTPIDPLSTAITSNPSPLLLSFNRWRAQLSDYRKHISSRRNRHKIDI